MPSDAAIATTATDELPASVIPPAPLRATREPAAVIAARSRPELEAIVRNAFTERGLDADRAIRLVQCESRFDPLAQGDGGQSVGLFQFRLPTFAAAARRLYGRDVGDLRADPVVSSMVAAAKIAHDGDWSAWTCAR